MSIRERRRVPSRPRTRVVIADGDPSVRRGLRALLSLCGDVTIVGEATDGSAVLSLVGTLCPDTVLMDAHLPLMSGMETARVIKEMWPAVRVVLTTMFPRWPGELYENDADAILVKGCSLQELTEAITGCPVPMGVTVKRWLDGRSSE